ncbi:MULTISPECIES: hypothetical protein [Staphylococcus]|uniref:hypothetical protein n=1 Tax=Staphylococcus TaxID=1279 RepID=UPI0015D7BFB4|nr:MULTISPECIES: hypothetical protein [Staphylococcus]MDU6092453.1 hypothetical protein [Staphylococcus lugdunensis]HCU7193632.1 hypothetical protein [Staphylococcus aureus]
MRNDLLKLHEIIRNQLQDDNFKEKVRDEHVKLEKIFDPIINNPEYSNFDIKNKNDIQDLTVNQRTTYYYLELKTIFSDYYVTKGLYESDCFDLIGKEFDVVGRIRISADFMNINNPNPYVKKMLSKYGFMIELVNIDSYKKNAGLRLIKQLIKLSKKAHIPIWLYDLNTKKNYFDKLNFKFKGNLGLSNEPLKIYVPK